MKFLTPDKTIIEKTEFKGIDVSKHQGVIDWEKVKADGVQFAIIRAGFGNVNIDDQFFHNITECNRLGIPCGVYWFSYALSTQEAAEEAKSCLELIKPYKIDYPVCFDLEYDTIRYAEDQGVKINKKLATEMAIAFLSEVEKAGYHACNYTNKDYSRRMFNMKALNRFDTWYALWISQSPNKCPCKGAVIWQHTSKGKVNGIKGNVDLDIAYKEYVTAKPKEETPAEPEPSDEPIKVGDIVEFTGTKHYVSANSASGKSCKSGKAKVTRIYNGKHPYHLVAVKGEGSNVYGWVDKADIKGLIEDIPASPEPTDTIKIGDKVKCKAGAKKYTNGVYIPRWVANATLYVREIEKDGTVYLVSTEPIRHIYTGRIYASDVEKI